MHALYIVSFSVCPLQLISSVIGRNWTELARSASLDNWREILAALVTYAGPEEFSSLCGQFVHLEVIVPINNAL